LGIPDNGCTVVDESDGTIIDDDDVLLQYTDKVLILLENADEWAPAQQLTSHPAESVNIAAATSPTNTVSTSHKDTEVSHAVPSFGVKTDVSKQVDFGRFAEALLSINYFDPENLTVLARCLLSLDISEDRWKSLWANETFVEFVNNCALHPPAEMHVVSMLKSNKIAQNLAPISILAKYSITHAVFDTDDEAPKRLNRPSLFEVRELLQRVINDGSVSEQFMHLLEVSVNANTRLEREMTAANAMIHWSPARRTFESPWNRDTVKQVLANINEYENEPSSKPGLRPSLKNRKSSDCSCEAAGEAVPETETINPICHRIVAPVLEVKYECDDCTTDVWLQRHSTNMDTQMTQQLTDRGNFTHSDNGSEIQNHTKSDLFPQFITASLLGEQTFKVTQTEYYRINAILPKPEVHETNLEGFIGKVLPYVLQRVKMRGCCILQPSRFSTFVHREVATASKPNNRDPFSQKSTLINKDVDKQYTCPVSRLDCITCLLGSVDSIVAKDLLLVMSQFPIAFPLIMRNIADEGKYSLMTSLLRGIVVKWESGSGKIIEHSLFNDPFKLLVAVRLGDNNTGKSAILNQLLAKEHTFSTRGEPGSEYGKPATVDGTVEFIWLTQENCKDILWESVVSQHYSREENTITLLANLHGDAVENSDIIAFLSRCFQCQYLAFVMPTCTETQWKSFTSMIPSIDNVAYIRIDPKNDCTETSDIQTSSITEDKTLHKVRSCLDEALKSCSVVKRVDTYKQSSRLSLADGIDTEMSQKIIDFVACNTCKSTKEHLQLQQQAQSCNEQNVKPRIIAKLTHDVVRLFIGILQSQPDVRQRAVIHLENELSRLCNAETQKVRLELSQLKAELRTAMVNSHTSHKDTERIRKNIADTLNVIDSMNLGVEHFFREVGYLYKLQLLNKTGQLLMLPQNVAELFLNGHPIELLDGDAGRVQVLWLNEIFNSVAKQHPKLRVYVISIIGLQSSGKSTLLNSLFACRFAVSVGRCSRGLFMRLLFLDKEVAKAFNVDAVLLIDTEGLGSPEKMGDLEAEKKDRLLATFAMGISNLAIINVLGEYIKELTEILQIAVVTMTRLEQADMAPDILLVQHLLTEKNSEKLSQSEEQFCEAIRNAVDLAEKKDVQVGAKSAKCLHALFARIQNGTLLTQFHPYKDGASANAPASEAYHNDVVRFYKKILTCCKASSSVFEFKRWKALLEGYWECVTREDFALRFKNIKEIYDFIDRGQRIADVKQAIDKAFSSHARKSKASIATVLQDLHDKTMSSQNRQDFLRELEKDIKRLPQGCMSAGSKKCQACQDAGERQKSLYEYVQGQPYENETQTTMSNFIEVVRQSTIRKLSQSFDAMVVQKGCCVEFDNIITDHLKRHLSTLDAGSFTEHKCKEITAEIFAELSRTARDKDHDVPVRERIIEAILSEYRQAHDMVHQFNTDIGSFEVIIIGKQSFFQGIKNKFIGGNPRMNEAVHLKSMIGSLLSNMLEQRQADCYEDGMVGEVCQRLTELLDSVSRKTIKLKGEQKLNIHVWTLQQFCKRMEVMQVAWDKKNKPSSILEQNKKRYVQIINTRLEHGFTFAAEGQIIGQHLLKVIQQKAIAAENMETIRAVQGLVWTTNSQMVRLKYFKHLAEEVKNGNKDAALAHFCNPTEQIEKWYKDIVDTYHTCSKSYRRTFLKSFEQELAAVLCSIEKATNSAEIVSLAKVHCDGQSVYYQPLSEFLYNASAEELQVMKEEIVTMMKKDKDKFCRVDDKLFSNPSDDADVMSRLGCTARCFWCNALCWGQRGHEANHDETRKHHSSHQPHGLAGVHHRFTCHLLSGPCHELTDETSVYFGEYMDSGISWQVAKEQHFSDWKFDKHYNTKFDELMRWFFQELHQSIAEASESLKPATTEDLERYSCVNLNYGDIMSRVEQEIN